MAIFSGTVETVVFTNAADSFYILKMRLDDPPVGLANPVTVRGKVFGVAPKKGSWLSLEAILDKHPKYGNQLKIRKAPVLDLKKMTPSAVRGILISQGVSELVASAFVSRNRELSFSRLNSSDAVKWLSEISGVTKISAEFIIKKWKSYMAFFQTFDFFEKAGIPKTKYQLVWKTFGQQTKDILSSNPWKITRIDGITFDQADKVAKYLQLPFDCSERIEGACLYVVKSWRGIGHLYLTSQEVYEGVSRIIDVVTFDEVKEALYRLDESKDLVFEGFMTKGGVKHECVYSSWNYRIEKEGASLLHLRNKSADLAKDPSDLAYYKYNLIKCEHPDIDAHNLEATYKRYTPPSTKDKALSQLESKGLKDLFDKL